MTDGKFPGLKAIVEGLPPGATIAGYTKNAAVYRWSETEKRYVEVHDVPQEHYIKMPGEDWRKV